MSYRILYIPTSSRTSFFLRSSASPALDTLQGSLGLRLFANDIHLRKKPREQAYLASSRLVLSPAAAMAPPSEESSGSSTPDSDPKPLTQIIRKIHTNIRQVFAFRRFASSASPAIPDEDEQESRELRKLRRLSVTSISEDQVSPISRSSDRLNRHFR